MIRTLAYVCQGLKNVIFPETFVYVLNQWSLNKWNKLDQVILSNDSCIEFLGKMLSFIRLVNKRTFKMLL